MLLGAGWHWSLPYPIDEVIRIPITENQTVTSTVGWYFTTPEMEISGNEPPPDRPWTRRLTAMSSPPTAISSTRAQRFRITLMTR